MLHFYRVELSSSRKGKHAECSRGLSLNAARIYIAHGLGIAYVSTRLAGVELVSKRRFFVKTLSRFFVKTLRKLEDLKRSNSQAGSKPFY
jgi:hypothetical protein